MLEISENSSVCTSVRTIIFCLLLCMDVKLGRSH
jgi:hypothetical protein